MAKADETSSTIDWIWLRAALALAVEALGTVELAKKQLIEWLAAGKLPWSCMKWKGLTAEEIAKAEQQLRGGLIIHILPSAAYHEGDPEFWGVRAVRLQIDWEDNAAREPLTGGAQALGIKVSRTHLLTLLPGGLRKNKKVHALSGAARPQQHRIRAETGRPGPQMRRVLPVLKRLFPPHGKAPDDVPTEAVRALVNKELAGDSRNRELAAASWDTVNRALGRG
jgi:hypothetical protein